MQINCLVIFSVVFMGKSAGKNPQSKRSYNSWTIFANNNNQLNMTYCLSNEIVCHMTGSMTAIAEKETKNI